MTIQTTWKEGDRVIWDFEPSKGYGYVTPVAAVIRRVGAKRVTIEIAKTVRYPEHRVVRMLKVVKPEKLRVRSETCAELGESGE